MISIFDYTDYRLFLRDFYEAKKELDPAITHRSIADKVGFKSSGFFTQILQGKSNISEEMADSFASFCKLKKQERAFFKTMVAFNQARKHADKKLYFERMIGYNKGKVAEVDAAQYEFYDKWYYTVVREMLALVPVKDDYAHQVKLAKMITPQIKPIQVKQALRILEKLKFITKDKHGYYLRADRVISTGYDAQSVGITNFALASLNIARDALLDMPKEERSISNLTLSLSDDGYRELEEKLKLFRREVLELAYRDRGVNRVYQVNFQVVPVTEQVKKKRKK